MNHEPLPHGKTRNARAADLRIEHPCKRCGTSGVTRLKVCQGRFELYEICYACVGTGVEPERIT